MQAPFDPLQLLSALSSLLSPQGGIKSGDEVPKLASLMKKFSKKLVSRCIYCHVLKATKVEVISQFLDLDGWTTINSWLLEAKETANGAFLYELVELCDKLPMTLERLKKNNTAKLIKSLTKSDNEKLKKLSEKVVVTWMKLIKEAPVPIEKDSKTATTDKLKKKRKKEKEVKTSASVKTEEKKEEVSTEADWLKKPPRKSRHIDEPVDRSKRRKSSETLEDVDIKASLLVDSQLESSNKNLREPRPKTVKTFNAKFRSTGLIEENPIPKNNVTNKKTSPIDKSAIAAAKSAAKRQLPAEPAYFQEKKIKPSSLINTTDAVGPIQPGGIKLIAPKPRPTHILHESAGFMDALVSLPAPIRKKKRSLDKDKKGTPTSPTTPPANVPAPKLQFYKDTLELGDSESKETSSQESEAKGDGESMETDAESKKTVEDADDEETDIEEDTKEDVDGSQESEDTEKTSQSSQSGEIKTILTIARRKGAKKKSVRWVEDANLKKFFYFELDETERVNVNNVQNFGDMKSLEMKRERHAFDMAKRMMGDKMEEAHAWKTPRLLDLKSNVDYGCNSKERDVQRLHQETTLQELYFSKEMIPDSAQEPEAEKHSPQEPITIPLEDLNNSSGLMDYSGFVIPPNKPSGLPPVLTNLMMSIAGVTNFMPGENPMGGEMPPMNNGIPMMSIPPPGFEGMPPLDQNQWRGPPDGPQGDGWMPGPGPPPWGPDGGPMMQEDMPDRFFPGPGMMPPNMGMQQFPGPGPFGGPMDNNMMMGPGPMLRGNNMNNNNNNNNNNKRNQGPNNNSGPPGRRPPRIPCKHFLNGSCRFGPGCNFLHPGVNGPPL